MLVYMGSAVPGHGGIDVALMNEEGSGVDQVEVLRAYGRSGVAPESRVVDCEHPDH